MALRITLIMLLFTMPATTQASAPPATDIIYYDAIDASGRLIGGRVVVPRSSRAAPGPTPSADVVTVVDNGPPANRIDLVFVGDGYQVPDLPVYATHVAAALDHLLSEEPFATYATFFNAHRVEVISIDSGVDHDPVFGIERDTALDMGFWCNGVQHRLCAHIGKSWQFAELAPGADQVLAVANSTLYGGVGIVEADLAAFSGGDDQSVEIALHELGHSLGNLADEYFSIGAEYAGPERSEPNVSILDAAQMKGAGEKWAAWLGDPGRGFNGVTATFPGGYYHEIGIYRPTNTSKMRALFHPFNRVSIEALIIEFYRIVSPIDTATPEDVVLTGHEFVFVDPVDPIDHSLHIEWSVNGSIVPGLSKSLLPLGTLELVPGMHVLSVRVTDETPFVRDEAARERWMSESRTWTVAVEPPCPGDFDGSGDVGFADLLALLARWGPCTACFHDLNGNGIVDGVDLLLEIANWGVCPVGP